MLIGPLTLVLVAAGAMLLFVAELVVEAMVVLLVDVVLLMIVGTLRYPGRGGKENGESLERGRRHLLGKNKLRLSGLSRVLA